jgi:GNAT superfamily N-acetyltransferase
VTVSDDTLIEADFERLGTLLVSCLPTSSISLLGVPYSTSAFRYFDSSESEVVFVERVNGRLESACVMSMARNALPRRLLFHTGLVFHLALGIWRAGLWRALTGRSDGFKLERPEVFILFTSHDHRGHGLGGALLRRCEAFLGDQGHTAYCVRTEDDEDNPAIRFYHRNGFQGGTRFYDSGMKYRLMTKYLGGDLP